MTKRREGRTKGGHQWLYYWILKALVEQGDEGTKHATTHLVLKEIEGELVNEDRHRVSTGETRIENYIAWARADLVAVDAAVCKPVPRLTPGKFRTAERSG